ncbi:MAG: hypothetical protein IKP77_00075 [Acholeplasmatales bacterium]|nr:hypothetical protein [Acholeplasmatales bacterium]
MKKKTNLTKLYLMVITLPKGKKEIIGDMLEKYDVTAYLSTLARGAIEKTFSKELMFCVIKEDQIKDAMLNIQDKFARFRNNISMVYAIPLDSIIGVSSYMALSNGGKR